MLNRSVRSFFHGKPTSERPFCADCECPMILSRLEPDKPGFANRCPACSAEEADSPAAKRTMDADERKALKEANEARRRAMRDLLYRKDS